MNSSQKAVCVNATAKLMGCPASIPIQTYEDFDRKKKYAPIDLKTVMNRLQSDQYTSVSEWEEDVEKCFSYAHHFYKRDHYSLILVEYTEQKFHKMSRRLDSLTLSGWTSEIYELRRKMNDALNLMIASDGTIEKKSEMHSLTYEELKDIIESFRASKEFVNEEEVRRILKKYNCESLESPIDLSDIPARCARELHEYFVAQFNIRAMADPEEK